MIVVIVILLILIGIKFHYINKAFDTVELMIKELEQKVNKQSEMKYRIEELENMLKAHIDFHNRQ